MTSVGIFTMKGEVVEFPFCHCEEDVSPTRQSIVSRKARTGGCGLFTGSQWIATGFSPRDDKGGIFTMNGEVAEFSLCHCEEGDQVTDAAR